MIYFQPVLFKVEFRIRIRGVAAAAGPHGYRLKRPDFWMLGMSAGRAMAGLALHIGHPWCLGDGDEPTAGIPTVHAGDMTGQTGGV